MYRDSAIAPLKDAIDLTGGNKAISSVLRFYGTAYFSEKAA